MKIIIIEDEGITRQWLKKKLEELSVDYHVEGVFSNGRQALDFLITAGDVDVVFTDIRMPVMDGMEFLEKLQETGLEPYKVILSAYDEFQYARGAMRLGAQEFVLKPEITKEALQQILSDAANYLGQKQREKEERRAKEPDRERGAAFAELMKQDLTDMDELAAVLGKNVTKQDVSRLVIADIYLEKQALQESVEELLDLFLAQEGLCGVWFWSGCQRILLGYLHNTQTQRLALMERLGEILRVHTGIKPYIGISRIQGEGKVKEMYRQAVAARENRFFFGLCGPQQYDDMRISMNQDPGELYFNQDIKEIVGCLRQADYVAAVQGVDIFLEKVKKASYLHPAYVRALCDEILSACRYSLWDYALNEEEKERAGGGFFMKEETLTLEQLIGRVKGEVDELCTLLQKKRSGERYSAAVKEVIRYVEEHFGERISLDQVAEEVFLSKPYLSTLFKKETGKKFSSYLQEVRLEKSRNLLHNPRLTIGEIAEEAGFFDSAHYSRAFKEYYGCSPLEYRKTK